MSSAWTNFLSEIETATAIGSRDSLDFRPGEEPYFRGHTSCAQRLLPSLFRTFADEIATAKESDAQISKKILKLESDLFYEFSGFPP